MTRKGEDGGWPYEFSLKYLNALKPREKRYEKGERFTKGLRIVVHPNGKKKWRFTWVRGKGVVLGEYPQMKLAQARAECDRVLNRVNKGEDPRPFSRRAAVKRSERLQFRDMQDTYTETMDRLKAAQGYDNRSKEVLRTVLKKPFLRLRLRLSVRRQSEHMSTPMLKRLGDLDSKDFQSFPVWVNCRAGVLNRVFSLSSTCSIWSACGRKRRRTSVF